MQAGKLRHRIELQSVTRTRSGTGDPTDAWATFDTVSASIEPVRGKQLEISQQIQGEISHRIVVRYHSTLAIEHRILFGARVFTITEIKNVDERNIYQEIFANEAL